LLNNLRAYELNNCPNIYENPFEPIDTKFAIFKLYLESFPQELKELVPVFDWLEKNKLHYPCEDLVITHGDYHSYNIIVKKLEDWKELGFPNEEFEKLYNEAIKSVLEIRDWQKVKFEEYYPIIHQLISSSWFTKSEKHILKFLRKRLSSDKTIFFLLSALLRTNPPLHFKIIDLCEEKDVSFNLLKENLDQVMVLLSQVTTDPKVKNYIQLFRN